MDGNGNWHAEPLNARHARDVTRGFGSYVCFGWRIQPVDATHSSNISAGVLNPRVFLGRSFNFRAIASRLACE
jgi:hypothetical protein